MSRYHSTDRHPRHRSIRRAPVVEAMEPKNLAGDSLLSLVLGMAVPAVLVETAVGSDTEADPQASPPRPWTLAGPTTWTSRASSTHRIRGPLTPPSSPSSRSRSPGR
ncbi:MAG TPA: hypothetical protein VF590_05660 [Isosphaeraceae bacterium]